MNRTKHTVLYLFMAAVTLLVGFLSRSSYIPGNTLFGTYGGDILWAGLVYWGFALFFMKNSWKRPLKYSLIFSYAIELSQFNKEQWLMDLRATKLGALVLGHDFLFSDLICYTIGIGIALVIDYWLIRRELPPVAPA